MKKLKAILAVGLVLATQVSLAEQRVAGPALEDSFAWLDLSLASAVLTSAMTPIAANTYANAVRSGTVSRTVLVDGLAADYGIGGTAVPFVPPIATEMPDIAKKKNCTACHAIDTKIVGPAWYDVAIRYKGDTSAEAKLIYKVANGGSGAWGVMPEIPNSRNVSNQDIRTLVKFILSLNPPSNYASSDVALNPPHNPASKPFNAQTLTEGLAADHGMGGTTSPSSSVPSTGSSKPVEKTSIESSASQKLRDLNALYKDGVINQKDFETKKKQILEAM